MWIKDICWWKRMEPGRFEDESEHFNLWEEFGSSEIMMYGQLVLLFSSNTPNVVWSFTNTYASFFLRSFGRPRIKTGGLDDLLLNRSWELCCNSAEEIDATPPCRRRCQGKPPARATRAQSWAGGVEPRPPWGFLSFPNSVHQCSQTRQHDL